MDLIRTKKPFHNILISISMLIVLWSPNIMADSLVSEANAAQLSIVATKSSNGFYGTDTSIDSCNAYFSSNSNHAHECRFGEVPPQVAIWLFLVAILGFIGFLNRNKL